MTTGVSDEGVVIQEETFLITSIYLNLKGFLLNDISGDNIKRFDPTSKYRCGSLVNRKFSQHISFFFEENLLHHPKILPYIDKYQARMDKP